MSGGAFGLAALAGVGVTMLPPSFPSLEGSGTIDERIAAAGLADHVLRLTPGTAGVLVVGTTDCAYCRDFAENGLDDLVAFAQMRDLGLVYAPVGSSATSLASTRLLSCFARGSDADPATILRSVYAAAREAGSDGVETVARAHGARLGVSDSEIADCLAENPLGITRRIQSLSRAFPARGTPAFYVAAETSPEQVSWFTGWAGTAGLRRQIAAARGL